MASACGCNPSKRSGRLRVILLWGPGYDVPMLIGVKDDKRCCLTCNEVFDVVQQAVDTYPPAGVLAETWSRALIVDCDGSGLELHPKRLPGARA